MICRKCKREVAGKWEVLSEYHTACIGCIPSVKRYLSQGVRDGETEQLEHKVMNFYTLSELQAVGRMLKANEPERERRQVELCEIEDFVNSVEPVFKEVSEDLAGLYFDYLFAACVGEIGHHCRKSGCHMGFGTGCRLRIDREGAIEHAVRFDPETALMLMAVGFTSSWFDSGGFGGKSWGRIADAGLLYFNPSIPKDVFLDHVVDLTHNNGLFLGKTAKWFRSEPALYLKLLDTKRCSSVLKLRTKLYVTAETRRLVAKAKRLKIIEVETKLVTTRMKKHVRVEYGKKVMPVSFDHVICTDHRARVDRWLRENCERLWGEHREAFWAGVDRLGFYEVEGDKIPGWRGAMVAKKVAKLAQDEELDLMEIDAEEEYESHSDDEGDDDEEEVEEEE